MQLLAFECLNVSIRAYHYAAQQGKICSPCTCKGTKLFGLCSCYDRKRAKKISPSLNRVVGKKTHPVLWWAAILPTFILQPGFSLKLSATIVLKIPVTAHSPITPKAMQWQCKLAHRWTEYILKWLVISIMKNPTDPA